MLKLLAQVDLVSWLAIDDQDQGVKKTEWVS